MNVLFGALHFAYFRNFESVVLALAERGHHVHLAADEPEELGGRALVERLAAASPRITYGFSPSLDGEAWFRVARRLRVGLDFVRFHEPAFKAYRKIRLHLAERTPRGVLRAMESGIGATAAGRRLLTAALGAAERLMPVSEASREFIRARRPDVVLLASVTAWRAPQIDHLRAARSLGVRTGVCVFSWDHLSSKALIRQVPDRVFVWNETQKREAVEWHHLPEARVAVTGSQCYDQWFGRRPSRDRAAFCEAVGLAADRPMLLYVCSVMTPDPHESRFVLRWVEEVRRSPDPRLREAGILIRPHPERMDEWDGVSLERFGNVALYGRNPVSPEAQNDYFDSLYHSDAVVGLVTSAFLEAAIVGRPVHTPLLPEFEMYQEGVQHFRYLMEVEGGLLRVARTFPDHLAALSEDLARAATEGRPYEGAGMPPTRDERNARFVRAFVRPAGLDLPATPLFVEAVEQMAAAKPLPAEVPGAWHALAQPVVRRLVQSADAGWLRPLVRDTRELQSDEMEAGKARFKETQAGERASRHAQKQRVLEERRRDRRREQRASSQRKHLARLKGRLRTLMGLSH